MSDLINRNTLIKEIKSLNIVLNGKQIFSDDAKDTILKIIDEQPTAYDVDKIISQLEDYGNEEIDYYRNTPYENYIRECVSKAIEIVKQNNVSQDDTSNSICEWKQLRYNGSLFETSCSNVSGMYRGFSFCPYCGKEIKVK